jgi:hypothetical protein
MITGLCFYLLDYLMPSHNSVDHGQEKINRTYVVLRRLHLDLLLLWKI